MSLASFSHIDVSKVNISSAIIRSGLSALQLLTAKLNHNFKNVLVTTHPTSPDHHIAYLCEKLAMCIPHSSCKVISAALAQDNDNVPVETQHIIRQRFLKEPSKQLPAVKACALLACVWRSYLDGPTFHTLFGNRWKWDDYLSRGFDAFVSFLNDQELKSCIKWMNQMLVTKGEVGKSYGLVLSAFGKE